MKKLMLALSIVSTACAAYAGVFEHIGGGVRAAGMGDAAVAVADDASSVYWNPAGLLQMKRDELQACRSDLYGLGLISNDNYFYGHPGLGLGAVGFGIMRLGTTSNVSYMNFNEQTFIFSFGIRPPWDELRNLYLGMNLKYYQANELTTGTGYGVDLGMQYKIRDFYIGADVQDLNWPDIHYQSGGDDILMCNTRLGIGYKYQKLVTIAMDWDNANEVGQFYTGAEVWLAQRLIALRVGAIRQDINDWSFTTGLGLRVGGVQFDYALKKHFDLDNTSTFSLTLKL